MKELMPMEGIHTKIYLIRGHRVMIDKDLAVLYKVTVFNLNKAVKRNLGRFPADFMFQLNQEEYNSLLFQIGISKKGRGGRRFLPYAFTELERKATRHDAEIRAIFEAIRKLVAPLPEKPKERIGFYKK